MSVMLAAAMMLALQGAPSAADLADAKCVAALSVLGDQAEEKDKPDMQAAMLFYMGKIVGRSGARPLTPAMETVTAELKAGGEAGLAAIAEDCGTRMGQAVGGG